MNLQIAYVLGTGLREIEPFVLNGIASFGDVFTPLFASFPFLILILHYASLAKTAPMTIGHGCTVLYEISEVTFFMVYFHAAESVLRRQRDLVILCADPNSRLDLIRREKWEIRALTAKINSLFAVALSMHHLQLFISTIYFFATFVGGNTCMVDESLLLWSLTLFCIELFRCSQKSSSLARACSDAERNFSKRFLSDRNSLNCYRLEIVDTLSHRVQSDSFRIGCFSASVRGFSRFLLTVVTCAAVVLQFDYKVVYEIQMSPKEPSSM